MAKNIVKEIIILLLISLAILLILGIILYDYMPNNKIIPEVKEYQKSAEMKEALLNAKAEEGTKVVLTYEITDSDLKMYARTNEYVAGKSNPFEEYKGETVTTQDEQTSTGNTINTNTNGSNNSGTNGTTGGTLFENSTTK